MPAMTPAYGQISASRVMRVMWVGPLSASHAARAWETVRATVRPSPRAARSSWIVRIRRLLSAVHATVDGGEGEHGEGAWRGPVTSEGGRMRVPFGTFEILSAGMVVHQ